MPPELSKYNFLSFTSLFQMKTPPLPSLPKWLNQFRAKLFRSLQHFSCTFTAFSGNRAVFSHQVTVLELIKRAELFVTTRKRKFAFSLRDVSHVSGSRFEPPSSCSPSESLKCLQGKSFTKTHKDGFISECLAENFAAFHKT